MNKGILFPLYQARYLSAGHVNISGDQNIFFQIWLVCWLESKKQLRTRNAHGMGTSWGSQPIMKCLELVAFSSLPHLPPAPSTLLKGPPAGKQLHLFRMALGLDLDQVWYADGMHCISLAGC